MDLVSQMEMSDGGLERQMRDRTGTASRPAARRPAARRAHPGARARLVIWLAVAACSLWCATPAALADFDVGPAQAVPGTAELGGVACADDDECFAVGSAPMAPGANGGPAAVVAVADGVAGGVQPVLRGVSTNLRGIACPDAGDCLAAGSVRLTGGGIFAGGLVPITAGAAGDVVATSAAEFSALACAGPGGCLAAGDAGGVGEVTAVSGTGAGAPQSVAGTSLLEGVACAGAADTCLAVGGNSLGEGVVVQIVGGIPGAVLPPLTGVSQLNAVACADAMSCLAVGAGVSGDGVLVTITGGVVGAVEDVPGTSSLEGVACASESDCVAVGSGSPVDGGSTTGVAVPITDGVVGSAAYVTSPDAGLVGVGCATNGECLGVGTTVTGSTLVGAVVPILTSGQLGAPTAVVTSPSPGQTYGLNAPVSLAFACQPAFAGTPAPSGACAASLAGRAVTSGQALDTTHAGTFTLTVTAGQSDGQQSATTVPFTVEKGLDQVFFPQLGPYAFRHAAVPLSAIAASGLPVLYTVTSGSCAVSGSTLTLGAPGQCVVRADQPGNSNYLAATASSTIVVGAPTPPVCAGLPVGVLSGQAATVALGCADAPADAGDSLVFAIVSVPSHGTLTGFDGAAGTVTYTPDPGYAGADAFSFDAIDAQGVSGVASVAIAVSAPPANLTRPVLTGTAAVGHALRCSPGTWSGTAPLAFAYQWERHGARVAGRTAASYTVGRSDLGRSLACTVTARNGVGSGNAQSPALAVPLPSNAFVLGKPKARGQALAVRLVAPGPGRFRAAATLAAPSRTAAGGARGARASGAAAMSYGAGSATAAKAGALSLEIEATSHARAAVRTRPHATVSVSVTFTPTYGKPRTKTTRLTL